MRESLKPGVNDLATVCPKLAAQWHSDNFLTADSVKPHSNKKVWWQCPDHADHKWFASPGSRIVKPAKNENSMSFRGCPYCTNRLVLPGFNDLASYFPEVAAEYADDLNSIPVDQVAKASNKKVWWRCSISPEHEWQAMVSNRTRQKQGCPYCKNKRVASGLNDLATKYPAIAAEWHDRANGLKSPSNTAPMSHANIWWQCPLYDDHVYEMMVSKRTARGQGCPFCAGRRVLEGFNDLATLDSDKAAMWAEGLNGGLMPKDVTVGSDKLVMWRCTVEGCTETWQQHVYADIICPRHGKFSSQGENDLIDFVRQYAGDLQVFQGRRILEKHPRVQFDVWVPELKLAIEFNGVFWHSERTDYGRGKHEQRAQWAREEGITLMTVWEDDWNNPVRRNVIERSIARRLGASQEVKLSARDLKASDISTVEMTQFLRANHVQGDTPLTRSFALRDNDGNICAVLGLRSSVKGSRTRLDAGDWEIRRYATSALVRGGFTKLLKHAERVLRAEGLTVSRWVSFAAHEVSDGGLYEKAGFVIDHEVACDYMYAGPSTQWKRVNKQQYMKSEFKRRDDLQYREGLTESDLAILNGLTRVWDSGKVCWVKGV